MSGWLPPGCTDKDIDDAAPQNEPEDEEEINIEAPHDPPWGDPGAPKTPEELRQFSAGECEHTIRDRFNSLLANGCRKAAWEIFDEMGKKLRNSIPRPGGI
jgi:hypothetical protein